MSLSSSKKSINKTLETENGESGCGSPVSRQLGAKKEGARAVPALLEEFGTVGATDSYSLSSLWLLNRWESNFLRYLRI